ncbi:endo alpha-1,4 polygalactosaminidase [Kribbella deserti]|uniref:Endo alpha-1,4 polygalactosaminidase n=1 Tax=Kribbella deserti TaxID=1926257 RepID=A0ABV6QPR7_9ACTN
MSILSKSLLATLAAVAVVLVATHNQPDQPAEDPQATQIPATAKQKPVKLPPPQAPWDYQLAGPYPPAGGVKVVSRDRTAPAVPGRYNICYVNAFQVQPGAQSEWDSDLLLKGANGNLVMDEEWGEPLLDLRTDAQRRRIAAKVNRWIDGCAAAGYQAVEPDNYDSFSRSKGLLRPEHATAYIKTLADHTHKRGLAIAQKNTLELAGQRESLGLDFAVVEECGQHNECRQFTSHFGTAVVIVEYTDQGLENACATVGDQVSVVRRDVAVSTPGSAGYVRKTC